MKIIHAHLLFALPAAACALLLLATAYQHGDAARVNARIAEPGPAPRDGEPLEATLARGVALARAGDAKGAERAYQTVLQHGAPALQQRARYNLGNLQMRQAMRLPPADPQVLPLVELAKQQYRDVLADAPRDWDVRYNLERALWLVPEPETSQAGEQQPKPEVRIPKPIMIDPGELP